MSNASIFRNTKYNYLFCSNQGHSIVFISNKKCSRTSLLKEYYIYRKHKDHPLSSILQYIDQTGIWGFWISLQSIEYDPVCQEIDHQKYLRSREKRLEKAKIKYETLTEDDILKRRAYRTEYRKTQAYKDYMKKFRSSQEYKERRRQQRKLKNI